MMSDAEDRLRHAHAANLRATSVASPLHLVMECACVHIVAHMHDVHRATCTMFIEPARGKREYGLEAMQACPLDSAQLLFAELQLDL